MESRVDAILNKTGLNTEEEKQKYKEALEYSSSGYTIYNNYNPSTEQA